MSLSHFWSCSMIIGSIAGILRLVLRLVKCCEQFVREMCARCAKVWRPRFKWSLNNLRTQFVVEELNGITISVGFSSSRCLSLLHQASKVCQGNLGLWASHWRLLTQLQTLADLKHVCKKLEHLSTPNQKHHYESSERGPVQISGGFSNAAWTHSCLSLSKFNSCCCPCSVPSKPWRDRLPNQRMRGNKANMINLAWKWAGHFTRESLGGKEALISSQLKTAECLPVGKKRWRIHLGHLLAVHFATASPVPHCPTYIGSNMVKHVLLGFAWVCSQDSQESPRVQLPNVICLVQITGHVCKGPHAPELRCPEPLLFSARNARPMKSLRGLTNDWLPLAWTQMEHVNAPGRVHSQFNILNIGGPCHLI